MADDLQEPPRLPRSDDEEFERSKEIEEVEEEERKELNKKKMEKRLYQVSPEDVEAILSFNPSDLADNVGAVVDRIMAKNDFYCGLVGAEIFGSLRAAFSAGQDAMKDYKEFVLAGQEMVRRDLETKGCVTYEAVDEIANHEDIEEVAAAPSAA